MAHPAPAQGSLGDAGAHPFKKRKRPIQRVLMTIFAGWNVLGIFFDLALGVQLSMNTGIQKICHIFVRKFFFTGGLNNMALG